MGELTNQLGPGRTGLTVSGGLQEGASQQSVLPSCPLQCHPQSLSPTLSGALGQGGSAELYASGGFVAPSGVMCCLLVQSAVRCLREMAL